jgi:hypothetical protein
LTSFLFCHYSLEPRLTHFLTHYSPSSTPPTLPKSHNSTPSVSSPDAIQVTTSHCHWYCTFTTAIKAYHLTQLHIFDGTLPERDPHVEATIENYIKFKRELCGIGMIVGFVEVVEGLVLDKEDDKDGEFEGVVGEIKEVVGDIVVCAWVVIFLFFSLSFQCAYLSSFVTA